VKLWVNGKAIEAPEACSVSGLLTHLNIDGTVAVERNGELVRRADQASTRLNVKDRLEIVHFVGGG